MRDSDQSDSNEVVRSNQVMKVKPVEFVSEFKVEYKRK